MGSVHVHQATLLTNLNALSVMKSVQCARTAQISVLLVLRDPIEFTTISVLGSVPQDITETIP